jgi:hypothetical protein
LIEEVLIDSKPLQDISQGENLRFISKIPKLKQYSRFSNAVCSSTRYKKSEDLAVINFIPALVSEPPLFNLHRVGLEKNKDIVEFIKQFNPSTKVNENSIALLKNRSIKWRSVPRTKHSEDFVKYLLHRFKEFDESSFFRRF